VNPFFEASESISFAQGLLLLIPYPTCKYHPFMQLFINLPVEDIQRSRTFFGALGFDFVEGFSGPDNVCVRLSDQQFIMLLNRPRFADFVKGDVADPQRAVGCTLSIHLDHREEVTSLVEKAFALGARPNLPASDHGFMLGWSFLDLDGYLWEPFWMDPAHAASQQSAPE
jgi:predicted lactoylglutathione lyase